MDYKKDCLHTNCTIASANISVHQTISEMDWERGLWYAAFNGDEDRIKALIDKSRNARETVNAPDNSGYTALHYAASNGYENICNILLQNGAVIDAQTSGKATPLHKAAAAGKMATVMFLIHSGANACMQDVDGQTALHKAVENKHSEVIKTLLEVCPELRHIPDFKGRFAIQSTIHG